MSDRSPRVHPTRCSCGDPWDVITEDYAAGASGARPRQVQVTCTAGHDQFVILSWADDPLPEAPPRPAPRVAEDLRLDPARCPCGAAWVSALANLPDLPGEGVQLRELEAVCAADHHATVRVLAPAPRGPGALGVGLLALGLGFGLLLVVAGWWTRGAHETTTARLDRQEEALKTFDRYARGKAQFLDAMAARLDAAEAAREEIDRRLEEITRQLRELRARQKGK